jgi:hypothetical protein
MKKVYLLLLSIVLNIALVILVAVLLQNCSYNTRLPVPTYLRNQQIETTSVNYDFLVEHENRQDIQIDMYQVKAGSLPNRIATFSAPFVQTSPLIRFSSPVPFSRYGLQHIQLEYTDGGVTRYLLDNPFLDCVSCTVRIGAISTSGLVDTTRTPLILGYDSKSEMVAEIFVIISVK